MEILDKDIFEMMSRLGNILASIDGRLEYIENKLKEKENEKTL